MLRILFLGDIVGEPGRKAVIGNLAAIREEEQIDFVIANGENAAGGRGITPKIAIDLMRAGVAVITSGDHIWDQKEIVEFLDLEPRMLRPLNYPDGTPGGGTVETVSQSCCERYGYTYFNPYCFQPFEQ